MTVAVVTDSTSYLPSGWAEQWGVDVVPVQVIIGGKAYDETDPGQAELVAAALQQWQPVTTSRPAPARFLQAFDRAGQAGADEIVVATLSAALSATHESALLAAAECSIPVTVVDTRSIAMGLGFAVVAGAQAARSGANAAVVADVIGRRAEASSAYFYVDTLEYLRRGGRVSAAKAAMGQALRVKPLLTIVDGQVVSLEQVRTSGKALARLAELAVAAADGTAVDIAVQHLDSADRAAQLAADLRATVPGCEVVECPIGGVVGAHVGPGMVAVVVAPRLGEVLVS